MSESKKGSNEGKKSLNDNKTNNMDLMSKSFDFNPVTSAIPGLNKNDDLIYGKEHLNGSYKDEWNNIKVDENGFDPAEQVPQIIDHVRKDPDYIASKEGLKKVPLVGDMVKGLEGGYEAKPGMKRFINKYLIYPIGIRLNNSIKGYNQMRKRMARRNFIARATEYGKKTNSPVANIGKLIDLYDARSDKEKEILNKELVKSLRKLKKKRKKYSPEVVEEVNTANRDFMKIFVGGNTKIDKAVEDGTMQKWSKEYNKAKKEVLIGSLEHLYKGQKIAKKNKWESADKYFTDTIIELDDDLQKLIVDGEKAAYNKEIEYTYKDGGDKKFGMSTDEELDWVNDKLDNAYFEGADIKNRLENKFYENDESKKNDEKLFAKNIRLVRGLHERKKVLEARKAKEKAGKSQTTTSSGRFGTSSVSGPNSAASGGTVGTSGNVIPTSNGAGQTPGIAAVGGKVPESPNPKTEVAANTGVGKEAKQAPGVATHTVKPTSNGSGQTPGVAAVGGKVPESPNPKTEVAANTGVGKEAKQAPGVATHTVKPTSNGSGQTPGVAAVGGKVPESPNPKTEVAANTGVGKEAKQAPGVATHTVKPTSNGAGQTPGIAAFVGKVPDTQNPKADAAAQTGMAGVKCSCCVELKAIRSFLENSKLSRTDKEKAGKKLDEFETIVTTKEHSEVYAAVRNTAPEAIEMSAGKITEFTEPVEKVNLSPVYVVDGTSVKTEDHSEVYASGENTAPKASEMLAGKMTKFTVPDEKINSSPVYMVDGKTSDTQNPKTGDAAQPGMGSDKCSCCVELKAIRSFLENSKLSRTDKEKAGKKLDEFETIVATEDHSEVYAAGGNTAPEAITKQPSFHIPGIDGKATLQNLPALPGPIGANAEIIQNLPYIPGSGATGQNGLRKLPDLKGLNGLTRLPESVNEIGIRPDDISVKEQILRNYLYDRNKDNTGTSIAVDGALKPSPVATGGMAVEQDMIYRKDGDYRNYTRINGKALNTFNPDVAKRHFPSSLKSAKNEIKESFRNKMNQPLNVAAAPVGTAGIDDVRAQMTRVKEAPNPGENMQAVLNRMGQTLKHIDTVLNNRLPGDNF